MKKTNKVWPARAAGTVAMIGGMGLVMSSAFAAGPYTCLPTCPENDGRFLGIAGEGLATLAQGDLFFEFVAPANATSLEIGIFDGDTGGAWDLNTTTMEYTLYADPDGDRTGMQVVARYSGDGQPFFDGNAVDNPGMPMPDNDEFKIVVDDPAVLADARGTNGNHFLRLQVAFRSPPPPGTLSNFKVRTDGIVTMDKEKPFAFEVPLTSMADVAILFPNYPDLSTSTYDGVFDFHFYVPASPTSLAVWDGDLDYGKYDCSINDTDDADTPPTLPSWATPAAVPEGVATSTLRCKNASGSDITGPGGQLFTTANPPDDNRGGPILAREPNVTYAVEDPSGRDFMNANPSGNLEWEQFRLDTVGPFDPNFMDYLTDSLPAGIYHIHMEGMDLGNLNAWRFEYETVGVCENGDPPPNGGFDGVVSAQALASPFPSCNFEGQGRMTGGGSVFTDGGTRVTHGFELHCDPAGLPNNLEVNWGGNGRGQGSNRFHLESLESVVCVDDPSIDEAPPVAGFDTYIGSGVGRLNGVPGATARWTFVDAGQPGVNDIATIVITDPVGNIVLSVSGQLDRGNQQAHP